MTKYEEAHLRILASGTVRVRTHLQASRPQRPLKRFSGRAKEGPHRPVVIAGKQYPSLTAARKAMRIGITTLYRMIDRGEASYA